MRNAASNLFGQPESLQSRANVFGELMKVLISPTKDVEEAVNWVIGGGVDPDISLHMRMLMNRYCNLQSIPWLGAATHNFFFPDLFLW